jgi:ABC-type Zn uptake system ZnuABC Zn-binding protein ZnuA
MRIPFPAVALTVAVLAASCFPSEVASSSFRSEPIHVVATIPVLKDLVEQAGGSHVEVVTLISGLENEHTYSPKPSDLVAIRKAQLLVQIGIGLEVWAQPLIKNSGNRDLLVTTTSKGIALIRDHDPHSGASLRDSRRPANNQGGNPHIWLDPENVKIMLRHITESLIQLDPGHGSDFRANQAAYLRRLDAVQQELIKQVAALQDRRFVVHHPAWPYFARRFRFEIAGEIITQSGAEPSARHIQGLIAKIRKERIRAIATEPQLNQKLPSVLAQETGAHVVVLSPLPGGLPGTDSYLDLLRYNVTTLADALAR